MARKTPSPVDPKSLGLSQADLLSLHRWMTLGRLLDDRLMNLQRQGRIAFYGVATGEEAAVAGSAFALRQEDWIFPALRQGLAALMRGMPLEVYIAQCIGNSLDIAKGRQMPVHYASRQANFVSWSSCIATQLPHAVGMAYAVKLKKEKKIALAYLGDGATSEGDFHVALNFAGVYRLPVVFFCQNNQWAISVPVSRQTSSSTIAAKARAYGFKGVKVDGNDVLAVYAQTRLAVKRALSGKGPTLIEALTYRLGSHSSSDDPTRYRSEEDLAPWKAQEPLSRFRKLLQGLDLWTKVQQQELETNLNEEISQAINKAESAPPLAPPTLIEDVYAKVPPHLEKQLPR